MTPQKMHIDEIHTNEALVRQLIDAQFPQWTGLPIKSLSSAGTDHALYRLGDELVVRLPRKDSASKQIDKELLWLTKLKPHLPLAIPNPLAAGTPVQGYPWLWSVYQWLEGKDASCASVSDERQTALALAEFLRALHQIDTNEGPPPGEHNFFRGSPLALRDKRTRNTIASLNANFNKDLMVDIWNHSLDAPVWGGPPCWIHGDLIPSNLLIQNGLLSAVIDFGGLGVGDPACDLLIAWTFLSSETRETFRQALSLDNATWDRGRGWALSMGVICLDYYKETNPVLAGIGRRAIEETLADFKFINGC